MVERIRKAPAKKIKSLNIAGNEISAVFDFTQPHAIAIEKFEILRKICLAKLGVIRDNPVLHKPYKKMMDHYLRNSSQYFIANTPDKNHIPTYKRNYRLFLSIVSRIINLTEAQKLSFLEKLKIKHDTAKKGVIGNPLTTMDSILSSL